MLLRVASRHFVSRVLVLGLLTGAAACDAVEKEGPAPVETDDVSGTGCEQPMTVPSAESEGTTAEGDTTASAPAEPPEESSADAAATPPEASDSSGETSNDEPGSGAPSTEPSSDSPSSEEGESATGDAGGSDDELSDGSTAASSDAGDDAAPGCGVPSCLGLSQLPSEGNVHVEIGTEVAYGHNPPASGSHYPIWAKFDAYDVVVPRSYWVHNLEHGGVVFLYGPSATTEQQAELRAAFDALPDDEACGTKRALLTPDPDLDDAIAVVAWTWVLEGSCVDGAAIAAFVSEHRGEGTEDVCGDGSFVP